MSKHHKSVPWFFAVKRAVKAGQLAVNQFRQRNMLWAAGRARKRGYLKLVYAGHAYRVYEPTQKAIDEKPWEGQKW